MAADLIPVDSLPDIVETWRDAIEALNVQADELAAAGDTPMLAYGLDRLRELRRQLGDLERGVEAHIAALMAGKVETIDGLGTLERRKGTDRKQWQSTELLGQVVRLAVDPDGTGELPPAAEVLDAVVEAVTSCVPITPSLGWRVTALRDRGFDPDEWCESKPGRTAVQIHKAETAA